jgi:GNAT superfamily N-acetyltransferase
LSGPGPVSVVAVADRASLDAFIDVPRRLQRDDPAFVAPLALERRETFDRARNPYFRHAEAQFWLALRDGRPVGRVSAQVDRLHLAKYADATGFFGLIEGTDRAVFRALLDTAEAWLVERGMGRAVGPFSLSVNEESGLLVDGFAAPPMVMMGHAPAAYGAHVEASGYARIKDLLAYDYAIATPLPEGARRMVARAGDRVRVRAATRKSYDADVAAALALYNEAWAANAFSLPLTEDERRHMASSMKPLVDTDLVALAELDGRLAAFAVALPNINEAIADLDGRLLPFGWAKLLWRFKVRGVRSARMPLMGVRPDVAGTPVGAALALMVIDAVRTAALAKGYARAELSWLLEDNQPVRRLVEAVGARVYKTYRLYAKALPAPAARAS